MTAISRDDFYIEDHAVLCALLLRAAETICGDSGGEAAKRAVTVYGKERGVRMAMRCARDGNSPTPETYFIYKEWRDDRGWSTAGPAAFSPVYESKTTVCGWKNSWDKHNLAQYGKIFCTFIDTALVSGFNPENSIDIKSILSHGDDACVFRFPGASFRDAEAYAEAMRRKDALPASPLKDFLYHTGHVYAAFRHVFLVDLGLERATAVLEKAKEEYAAIFGRDKLEAVLRESRQDFLTIEN